MKAYKVRLYKVPNGVNYFTEVDMIVVFKKLFSIQEAVTGYSNINVIPQDIVKPRPYPHVNKDYIPLPKKTPNGDSLFIIFEEMGSYTEVKKEYIDGYVSYYENSRWKNLYDDIKLQEEKQNQK